MGHGHRSAFSRIPGVKFRRLREMARRFPNVTVPHGHFTGERQHVGIGIARLQQWLQCFRGLGELAATQIRIDQYNASVLLLRRALQHLQRVRFRLRVGSKLIFDARVQHQAKQIVGHHPELLLNGLACGNVLPLAKGEQRLKIQRLRVLGRDRLHRLELLAGLLGLALTDKRGHDGRMRRQVIALAFEGLSIRGQRFIGSSLRPCNVALELQRLRERWCLGQCHFDQCHRPGQVAGSGFKARIAE